MHNPPGIYELAKDVKAHMEETNNSHIWSTSVTSCHTCITLRATFKFLRFPGDKGATAKNMIQSDILERRLGQD